MSGIGNTANVMSMQKKILAVVCLVLLLAVIWFYFFRSDDTAVIRSRIQEAADILSFQSDSNGRNVVSLAGASSLGEFVMPDVSIMVNVRALPGSYDFVLGTRSEVIAASIASRSGCMDFSCSVSDISVAFTNDSHTRAEVDFIATGKGKLSNGSEFNSSRTAKSIMMIDPDDGKWRFAELKVDLTEKGGDSSLIPMEW